MNKLIISKINASGVAAQEIPALLRENKILYNRVENTNWPKEFPYCPKMQFGIAHTGEEFLIHYCVEEQSVRAVAQKDNDRKKERKNLNVSAAFGWDIVKNLKLRVHVQPTYQVREKLNN